jgi:crotonobetainyl-CoA:carnitine CoA-transferase CaiB-like acyl-CoA transferase
MNPEGPLADIKILDFMWVMAGPASTRMLADYGAQVVRIESPTRIDTARTLQPHQDDRFGPDSSGLFGNCNAGKLGIAIDMHNARAREVIVDLVRWADVVTESFSPKAMRKWELDYDSLRKIRPDLIMLSTCLFGQTGSLRQVAGFGNMAAAISGFSNLAGWPDRTATGVFGAYTDNIVPRFTAIAILGALEHRRRTGEGQYIDQSHAESAIHFLTPAILEYSVNRRDPQRAGNADLDMAPHGVYAAAGDDQWVAIVCRNNSEWRSLREVMDAAAMIADSRFATTEARIANYAELDAVVGRWTAARNASQIDELLQTRGVPAYRVQNSSEAWQDAQLKYLGHFAEIDHPRLGRTTVEGPRTHLSLTPGKVRRAAPSLGQDNQYVLEKILGYDQDRISELAVAGLFG